MRKYLKISIAALILASLIFITTKILNIFNFDQVDLEKLLSSSMESAYSKNIAELGSLLDSTEIEKLSEVKEEIHTVFELIILPSLSDWKISKKLPTYRNEGPPNYISVNYEIIHKTGRRTTASLGLGISSSNERIFSMDNWYAMARDNEGAIVNTKTNNKHHLARSCSAILVARMLKVAEEVENSKPTLAEYLRVQASIY